MNKKGEWFILILIMLVSMAIGKYIVKSWWDYLFYPAVFSLGYFMDDIIKLFKKEENKNE